MPDRDAEALELRRARAAGVQLVQLALEQRAHVTAGRVPVRQLLRHVLRQDPPVRGRVRQAHAPARAAHQVQEVLHSARRPHARLRCAPLLARFQLHAFG